MLYAHDHFANSQDQSAGPPYLVIGPLTQDDAHTAHVVSTLGQAGRSVETFSAHHPTKARSPLCFQSRRAWAKTRTKIDQATGRPFNSIILTSGLGFGNIDKPRWQNRKMEEWRRIKLAAQVSARAQSCTLVIDRDALWFSALLIFVAFVSNPFGVRIARGSSIVKALRDFSPSNFPETIRPVPNSVSVIGVNADESGLSRNAAMSIAALKQASIPLFNDPLPPEVSNDAKTKPPTRKLKRPIAIHHVNADRVPSQIQAALPSFHIGFLLWELEVLPPSHKLAGELLDEVWVPSRYLQSIYGTHYEIPVKNVGKAISLPAVAPADMKEYDVKPWHHVVLVCFDAHSSVERKNPLAAVLAFQDAFPSDPNARLMIKTTPVCTSHWGDPNNQMEKIRAIARLDGRIIVDNRMLPFNRLLALIKRADCVVSSHRAEGFGYIPAYALSYARPVIATNYSGTMDLCTDHTAYPIRYKMIDTRDDETITPMENAQWADIDIDALSDAMRQVSEDPAHAQLKAYRGQKLLQERYSPRMQAKRYLDRFIALGLIEE